MTVHYWYIIRDLKRWNVCFTNDGIGSDNRWGQVHGEHFRVHDFELLESHPIREGALMVKVEIEQNDHDRIRIVDDYLYSLRDIEGEES